MSKTRTAIKEYSDQRRAQLRTIDKECVSSIKKQNEHTKMLRKYPILVDWIETLTQANNDLIKTIQELKEQLNETDSSPTDSDETNINYSYRKHQNKPTKKKPKDKLVASVLKESKKSNFKNSYENPVYEQNNLTPIGNSQSENNIHVKGKNNSLSASFKKYREFVRNIFQKESQQSESTVEHINQQNIEFIYVDKSVCCISSIANNKIINTQTMSGETIFSELKSGCAEKIQLLKSVTEALNRSLEEKENLFAKQMQEINSLKKQQNRSTKIKQTNKLLKNNMKTLFAENVAIITEAERFRKSLTSLSGSQRQDIKSGLEHLYRLKK